MQFSCLCDSIWVCQSKALGCSWANDDLPLHRRAWVFQEMALSSRIAYFTNYEVGWACLSGMVTDSRQLGKSVYDKSSWNIRPDIKTVQDYPGSPDPWTYRILSFGYLKTDISFIEDKLVAFAGIARAFYENRQQELGQYCAGLWERQLTCHLMWYKENISDRPESRYPAPTWSWASIHGSCHWEYISSTPCVFDVIEVDMQLVLKANSFGPVTGGRLRVLAQLLQLGVSKKAEGAGRYPDWTSSGFAKTLKSLELAFANRAISDKGSADGWNQRAKMQMEVRKFEGPKWADRTSISLDEAKALDPSRVFLLLAYEEIPDKDFRERYSYSYGLLLEQTVSLPTQYRRAGFVKLLSSDRSWKAMCDQFMIPEDAHLGKQDDGRYVIDLV